MAHDNDRHACPVCGTDTAGENHDGARMDFFNVTAIKNATTWVRIELADDDIRKLASGFYKVAVMPTNDS